jgi:pimeloyl-ACP methyl ester carboxylesterase
VAVHREHEFRAEVVGGSIVGWRSDDSGPAALLLHGGPSLSEYLDSLAIELAGVVTTARYQQRGISPSLEEGPLDVETHVADAVAVMDALGWDRAWLVGHSWGGHLAMHVAAAHPDRAHGLVVLDGLGAVGDGGTAMLGPNLTAKLSAEVRARVEELDAKGDRGEASEDEHREQMQLVWPYYFADPSSAPPMPEFRFHPYGAVTWASIMEHFKRRTLEQGLRAFTGPALVVHGERSPIPLVEAERTAALMPQAQLAVNRHGHWPWLEEPGLVKKLIAEVIAPA